MMFGDIKSQVEGSVKHCSRPFWYHSALLIIDCHGNITDKSCVSYERFKEIDQEEDYVQTARVKSAIVG